MDSKREIEDGDGVMPPKRRAVGGIGREKGTSSDSTHHLVCQCDALGEGESCVVCRPNLDPPSIPVSIVGDKVTANAPFVKKRENVIAWDDYFMSVAFLSAMRSKDPSTQVGACIVNKEKRIVGIGYNGFPRGCSDDELPWARTAENELDTKYPYVCHAEVNAILNKNSADVQGCSIYVGLFPCNECAKMIIQSGIAEVVYLSDKYADTTSMRASRRLLSMAQVKLRQHSPSVSSVIINFAGDQAIV